MKYYLDNRELAKPDDGRGPVYSYEIYLEHDDGTRTAMALVHCREWTAQEIIEALNTRVMLVTSTVPCANCGHLFNALKDMIVVGDYMYCRKCHPEGFEAEH